MTHKQRAIQAVSNMRGDDLYRAQHTFRGLSPDDLKEQHGQSGKTRQQILDEYQKFHDDCTATITAIEASNL